MEWIGLIKVYHVVLIYVCILILSYKLIYLCLWLFVDGHISKKRWYKNKLIENAEKLIPICNRIKNNLLKRLKKDVSLSENVKKRYG